MIELTELPQLLNQTRTLIQFHLINFLINQSYFYELKIK